MTSPHTMDVQSGPVRVSAATQADTEQSETSIANFLEQDRARIWAVGDPLRPPDIDNPSPHDLPNPILNYPAGKLFDAIQNTQRPNKRKLPYIFRQVLNTAEDDGSHKRSKSGELWDALQYKIEQLHIANLQLAGKDQLLREARSELRDKALQLSRGDFLINAQQREQEYLRTQLAKLAEQVAKKDMLLGQKLAPLDSMKTSLAALETELQAQKDRIVELKKKNRDLEKGNTRLVDQAIASAESIGDLNMKIAGLQAEIFHLLDTKVDVEEKSNAEKTIVETQEGQLVEQVIHSTDMDEQSDSLEDAPMGSPRSDSVSSATIQQLREDIATVFVQDGDEVGSLTYESLEEGYISPPDLEEEYQLLLERKTDLEKDAYRLSVKAREKDKSLRLKDAELSELKEEIAEMKDALVQKDEFLAGKEKRISQLNGGLDGLRSQLLEKESSLAEKSTLLLNTQLRNTQLLNKTYITETLQNTNHELESQLINCQESLAQANTDLEDRDAKLSEMNEFLLWAETLMVDTQIPLEDRNSIISADQMNETAKKRPIKSSKKHRQEKSKFFNEKKAVLKAEISKRSEALESRNVELKDKDKIIAKRDEELAETRRLLVEAKNKPVEKVSKLETELAAKDIEVKTLKDRLAAKDNELATLTSRVSELEQSLAFGALLDLRKRLAEKESELSQRISGLEADLTAKSELLETNTTRLTEIEASLGAKVIELREETALVVERNGQLSYLQREKLTVTEELEKLKRSSNLEIAQLTDNDKELRRQNDRQMTEKDNMIRQLRDRVRRLENQDNDIPQEADEGNDGGKTTKKQDIDHFGRQSKAENSKKLHGEWKLEKWITRYCCVIVLVVVVLLLVVSYHRDFSSADNSFAAKMSYLRGYIAENFGDIEAYAGVITVVVPLLLALLEKPIKRAIEKVWTEIDELIWDIFGLFRDAA